MAKYRVLVKSFINNSYIDPERMSPAECVVEYDGKPGSNLELVEDEAKAQKARAKKSDDENKGDA